MKMAGSNLPSSAMDSTRQRKRHELRDGDDDVDAGRFLHAARHEPHEQPQKRRRAHARQQVVAAFKRMEEVPVLPENSRMANDTLDRHADTQ